MNYMECSIIITTQIHIVGQLLANSLLRLLNKKDIKGASEVRSIKDRTFVTVRRLVHELYSDK